MQIQPYLFFDGRCEEAIEFYRGAVGAEVLGVLRFKESPDQAMIPPGAGDKVMHASFRVGDTTVMASDGRCSGQPTFQGFALSLTVRDEAEAERRFTALAAGGQVQMPLGKTFFSPSFGMVADRFGVSWMVYVEPTRSATAGARGEKLASQFEAKVREAGAVLERLSEADWKKVTEAERWSVGVTAHHLASAFEPVAGIVTTIVSGQSLGHFTRAMLDEMNAQHAREHADCTRAETLALLRKSGGAAAAVVRGLSDEQLAKRATVLADAPPMTAEQMITGALIEHVDEHLGSIRKTTGK